MSGTAEWLRLRVTADTAVVTALETRLQALGAVALTLLDAGDHPIHEPDPGATPLWPVSVVEALFPATADSGRIILALMAEGFIRRPAEAELVPLADQVWERAWMSRYQPMRFGRDLWICPSHIPPDPAWPHVIRLDPGLAFGTGTHPTTALCLEWLDAASLQGQTVIDYGAGSGVLAIAAALKGANRVIAVDHDPQALAACADNARRNGVQDRLTIVDPEQVPAVSADLLLANILAAPLIDLRATFTDLLRPGGALVLSGILEEQAEAVRAAYADAFDALDALPRDGWMRITGRRR